MKLHFSDQTFSFELLRTASYAIYGGAEIGEVLATAREILEGDFASWHAAWARTADRVDALAMQALERGHRVGAAHAFLRASNYHRAAEFFLAPDDLGRMVAFEKSRASFSRFIAASDAHAERVRIPYGTTTLPGYFYRIDESGTARPTLLSTGGFDSTGEEQYFFAAAAGLQRGYNVLTFEGPGQGEPLRVDHLPARPDYEVPISAAVDWLCTRPEVDHERVALMGTSLGGYYAARAAAFEPRVKALIVHGVVFDFWATQTETKPALARLASWKSPRRIGTVLNLARRFSTELRWSVDNAYWVFGTEDPLELIDRMKRYSLADTAALIRQPTLVLHGARDHFIPRSQVDALYDALRAPKTLRVFTDEEGAEEHCQFGNLALLHQVIFDWLDETL
jgi:dipeptidyl aminopeptidase/acylaminoacyl peptidase